MSRFTAVFAVIFAVLVAPAFAGEPTPDKDAPVMLAEAGTPKDKLIQIEVPLPKPLFTSTPKNIATANLEKPREMKSRLRLDVPVGTANVALNKPVTSSDAEPFIGKLSQITDGNKEGTDDSFVELWKGLQHVQIDLEKKHKLLGLVVWHFHQEPRVYRDFVVQVADDPDFVTNVRTLFNSDHDNSAGLGLGKDFEYIETFEGKVIEAKGVTARYVRLYSQGSTGGEANHYTEVEVYGLPSE